MKHLISIIAVLLLFSCSPVLEEREPVHVKSVSVSPASVSVFVGETVNLNATVLPADAAERDVVWSVSPEGPASVFGNGLLCALRGVEEGSVTVSCTSKDGGIVGTCAVDVLKRPGGDSGGTSGTVHVAGVKIDPSSAVFAVGESVKLTASVLPAGATDPSVSWSVTPEGVVSLSPKDGVCTLKGLSVGKAEVVCASRDGNKFAKCSVDVQRKVIKVTGVKVVPSTLSLVLGGTGSLKAEVLPSGAENKKVSWSSSAPGIVSVDADGTVKGLSGGTSVVTVKTDDGGFRASCTVTVKVVDAMAVVIDETLVHLNPGESRNLRGEVYPSNASFPTIEWKSSDAAVASVNSEGKVTAQKNGAAVITASAQNGKVYAKCAVSVAPVSGTEISPVFSFDGINPIPDGAIHFRRYESKLIFILGLPLGVFPDGGTDFSLKYGYAYNFNASSLNVLVNRPYVVGVAGGMEGDYPAVFKYGGFRKDLLIAVGQDEAKDSTIPMLGIAAKPAFIGGKVGSVVVVRADIWPGITDDQYYTVEVSDPSVASVSGHNLNCLKKGKTLFTLVSRDGKLRANGILEVY